MAIAAELGSPATLYNWRRAYGGMDTAAAKELKQLREQNALVRRLVAEAELEEDPLQEVARGQYPCHGFRRAWVALRYGEHREVNQMRSARTSTSRQFCNGPESRQRVGQASNQATEARSGRRHRCSDRPFRAEPG